MNDCTQMRRKLVRRGTLSLATGESKMTASDWVTEPCGIPLFGDGDKCRSCLAGWTHPENYPVSATGP